MSAIDVRPVCTRRDRRTFLTFPWRIYRHDPLWVPPLLPERARTIDPARGVFFKRGEAEFFIAWRDGQPVGTICAAEDKSANESRGKRECLFGFLEFVDDHDVVAALLDCVNAWARQRSLTELFGPYNLDYEDSYGVLIEGRDRPPVVLCGHTPPYYQQHLERLGFGPAHGDNLAYEIEIKEDSAIRQRLARLAERVRRQAKITVRCADLTQWDAEVDRVHRLLNAALAHLPDFIAWRRDAVEALLLPFRQVADPELILFVEVQGEAVGWLPAVANLNEAIIHANGLQYPWDYARLWWHMRRQPACLAIKSVLVPPAYWNTGVAVLLFDEMARRACAKGFKWADLSLTSDDNPNVPVLLDHMGARIYKRYRVYRMHV